LSELTTYQKIVASLKQKIKHARQKASLAVNKELLFIYWEIGKTILQQQEEVGWGAKVIDRLSKDLRTEFPDFKGLSVRNLKYMRAFAEAYPQFSIVQELPAQIEGYSDIENVQAMLAQITWYHHTTLLDKLKDEETRLFYIRKTVENGWSRNIMVAQIESKLHERQGKAIHNFKNTLPATQSDLAQETLKNPYNFDFLGLTEEVRELELERALIQHIKKFLLELGKGFAYVGNQKNIVVEGDDFFLDLLFYNYHMHCFVVFELKVGDFKPEFTGKLNFYVNTINEQLKSEQDAPTIGVLLCKTPNETVIKYSLKNIEAPIGIADYQLAEALPKYLKNEIPGVDELEAEIEKEYEELKSPNEKRWDTLKERLNKLNQEKVKEQKSEARLKQLIKDSFIPVMKAMLEKAKLFKDEFMEIQFKWNSSSPVIEEIEKVEKSWLEKLDTSPDFYFSINLTGFRLTGTEAFHIFLSYSYFFDEYWYRLSQKHPSNPSDFIFKKLYSQSISKKEIEKIANEFHTKIIDKIESNIERLENKDSLG